MCEEHLLQAMSYALEKDITINVMCKEHLLQATCNELKKHITTTFIKIYLQILLILFSQTFQWVFLFNLRSYLPFVVFPGFLLSTLSDAAVRKTSPDTCFDFIAFS